MSLQSSVAERRAQYVATGWQYAEDVVAKRIPASRNVRQACRRMLDNRKASLDPAYEFGFSEAAAIKVCAFVEYMPIISTDKPEFEGQCIRLQPWQVWFIMSVYGWLHRHGPRKGLRRFRKVYAELSRGNGKSSICSALALYHLLVDGGTGNEVYCAATSAKQARLVYDDCKAMVAHPLTQRLLEGRGVEAFQNAITVKANNSKLAPCSGNGRSLDGLKISGAIVDEVHEHRDRTVWDKIVSGAGKRLQSIIIAITTAGENLGGICYELHTYTEQLNSRAIQDDTFFGVIWSIDDGDDWTTEAAWRKANPNYGVSIDPSKFASDVTMARTNASAKASFLRLHLGVWQTAGNAWMDMERYTSGQSAEPLDIESFVGRECIIGCDLSIKNDLSALTYLFPERRQDGLHITAFYKFFWPGESIQASKVSQLPNWVGEGWITQHSGAIVDYEDIYQQITADLSRFHVTKLCFDPAHAHEMTQKFLRDAAPVEMVNQGSKGLTDAMNTLEGMVFAGKWHHHNPVMTWMVSNTNVPSGDLIRPRKMRPSDPDCKVDGVSSTVTALAPYLAQQAAYDGVDAFKFQWF